MAALHFDFQLIAKHWHRRTGYFAVLLGLVGIVALILGPNPLAFSLAAGATALVVAAVWHLDRRLPRTKRNKVGFVISMTSDDEAEAAKIRADLVVTLRRLIKDGRTGSSFQVIEVPQHHAETVLDSEDAQRLRLATRAHFLLYGRVRVRQVHGKPHHYIELDGVVTHQPVPLKVSGALAQEFTELLPRKVLISAENDLFAFNITSEWAELVAKYIIGCAAALSRDFNYAEKLYTEVLERLSKIKGDLPAFEKLRERLPKRIAELYEARARIAYERWANTHDPAVVQELGEHLSHIDPDKYVTVNVLTLNAIFAFLSAKSVARAIEWLHKVGGPSRDATWHLNVAFLVAYEDDLRGAIRHYRRALEQPMPADVIGKIEDFVYFVATTEEQKYQLYYCLGFFNWKVKRDLAQASKDFQMFLEKRQDGRFAKEAKLATKWLAQIEPDE